jgi:hypothetical protein
MDLHHRSDRELLSEIRQLVGSLREVTAKLVGYLAEVEGRRLHLQAGFSSMFEFCMKELKMSEAEAFRRILAARLCRRFPVIGSLLASGAVHLSALELVREELTEENHAELLTAISGKSKREVLVLLATRFPRADAPSKIRRLPGTIEPLSEARFKVEFTASAELREKIERCRDLLSHANPTRDLGVVVERGVDLLLADLEKKRLALTKRPRPEPSVGKATAGRVTNATRRKVFERDGLQCTYVSPDGRRCEARAFLELDHAEPRACGGGDGPENLRIRCRAHNQLWAEQAFGREYVESRRHFCQKKCEKEQHDEPHASVREAPVALEKVRLALRGMGFRDAQARDAVAAVVEMHDETPAVEQALREAILVATSKVG